MYWQNTKNPLGTSINFSPEIYLILYPLANLITHIAIPVVIWRKFLSNNIVANKWRTIGFVEGSAILQMQGKFSDVPGTNVGWIFGN